MLYAWCVVFLFFSCHLFFSTEPPPECFMRCMRRAFFFLVAPSQISVFLVKVPPEYDSCLLCYIYASCVFCFVLLFLSRLFFTTPPPRNICKRHALFLAFVACFRITCPEEEREGRLD